jgi:hypothetical protein
VSWHGLQRPTNPEAEGAQEDGGVDQELLAGSQAAAPGSVPVRALPSDSVQAEARAVGHVTPAVYSFYLGAMGIALSIVIVVSLLLMQVCLA